MHMNALNILNKPASVQEFFGTPVGKAMSSVSSETKQHIRKLVDIAYVLAQEEIAFNEFPKLVELEKRHGVDIGEKYATVPKDILNHLSKHSLALQSDDIDMLYALTILKQLYSSLASVTDDHFGDALSELLKHKVEMDDDGGLTYQGISLSHCSSIETFKDSYNDVLTQLHDVVHKRYSDLHENSLILE
ncbi:hypothetical protein PR048_011515 [Dryococelus australis]|uniref:Uncharacterized protein n=1 Tax=Dryococelus australis TaxID=614101 RepID=A0ABQ9HLS7_9NEOP|nr:hypothetical protein PR048_011515 [Dryococelus australis]